MCQPLVYRPFRLHAYLGVTMQATCTIVAVANLPILQIADASCTELPRHVLWQMLNLSELNSQLCGAVTPKEAWVLDQEQNNGMDLRDVLLHLVPLKLDFGIVQLGTRRTVHIHLRNTERCRPRLHTVAGLCIDWKVSSISLNMAAGWTCHGSLEAPTCQIWTLKRGLSHAGRGTRMRS